MWSGLQVRSRSPRPPTHTEWRELAVPYCTVRAGCRVQGAGDGDQLMEGKEELWGPDKKGGPAIDVRN